MFIGLDASRANRQHKSGVEWYAYHLIRNLYKIDFKNQYFLYTEKKLEAEFKPKHENFKEKIVRWPFGKLWTLGGLSLEILTHQPDVLFIPSHNFPLWGGKKNVITWHDVGYKLYPETYTKWELSSLTSGAKRAAKMADAIITISNSSKADIIKHYKIEESRIKVVSLGCNHEHWFPREQKEIGECLSVNQINSPYFIYIGRLVLRKNLVGLIKIYNSFRKKFNRPYNLILVGNEIDLPEEIKDEINNSPFKSEIRRLGWLPNDQLPLLLSGAEGLIFPSFYEGFGLPIIEAMACGCPVISSTSGSLAETVQDAGLLANAQDYDTFSEHMVRLIEDNDLRCSLIDKGLKRAQKFSWEKCVYETLKILESV